jgi:N-acetylmuramoyl-L-alanine amidase
MKWMRNCDEAEVLVARRIVLLACAALLCLATSLAAATPRIMYERALERERAVRPRLETARSDGPAAAEARRVVAAYQRVLERYPASGYCDNALWQAAALAADVWAQLGEDADRVTALRLYKRLVSGYPSSPLVTRAATELQRLDVAGRVDRPASIATRAVQATSGTKTDSHAAEPVASERVIPVPPQLKVRVRDVLTPPVELPESKPARLRSVSRTVLTNLVRVTIELDREVPYHDERIANPDRVFIDLPNVKADHSARQTQKFESGVVRQIRVGRPSEETTRVVLEIDGTASHSVFALYNPYRLIIDCERPGIRAGIAAVVPPESTDTGVVRAALVAPPSPPEAAVQQPSVGSRSVRLRRASVAPLIIPTARLRALARPAASAPARTAVDQAPLTARQPTETMVTPAMAPAGALTPSVNLQGRFSLSRQLGLGIARIVIDPGHGGHDPGAQVKGLSEADLVLDVGLRLEQLLLNQQGVEVVMTRRTQVFVPLEERTAIANRVGADLFLSIHANASHNASARGIETYFLNFASNRAAEVVAARENAASERTMHSLPDIVKAITLNDKLDESRDFATMVQRAMIDRLRSNNKSLRDLGVKQAPFVVLIGAGMPSVLAEISFVTHPQEGRLLKSPAYRQRIAEALFEGVARYQRSLKNVRTVANQ